MPLWQGLAVDLDGTLIEHLNSWDVIRDFFGLTKHMYRRMVLEGAMREADYRAMELVEWREKGVTKDRVGRLFHDLPIRKGAKTFLLGAREKGYKVAMISQAPNLVLKRFYELTQFTPDFEASYHFEFDSKGKIRNMYFPYSRERGIASKLKAIEAFSNTFKIPREAIVAVGDHANDLEMLDWAGYAIAVGPNHPSLYNVADKVVKGDLSEILDIL